FFFAAGSTRGGAFAGRPAGFAFRRFAFGFRGGRFARAAGFRLGCRGRRRGRLHGRLFGARVGGRGEVGGAFGHLVRDAAAAAGREGRRAEQRGQDRQRVAGARRAHAQVVSPSGPILRPQVVHSLRSFWAICRHHGQKRRFSTAQGSREAEGASGSTLPVTSSFSPV